jgi:hypothetical protein
MTDVSAAPTTKDLIIQGQKFTAPIPYAVGHTLTEAEARALNQVYHENLRNNFAKTVKASVEQTEGALSADALPGAFAKYVSEYSFSTPGQGGGASRTMDPVEREATNLAKELVKNALAKKGQSMTPPKEASDEQKTEFKAKIAAKIEEIAAKDEVLAQARKNVAARSKGLDAIAAGLDL